MKRFLLAAAAWIALAFPALAQPPQPVLQQGQVFGSFYLGARAPDVAATTSSGGSATALGTTGAVVYICNIGSNVGYVKTGPSTITVTAANGIPIMAGSCANVYAIGATHISGITSISTTTLQVSVGWGSAFAGGGGGSGGGGGGAATIADGADVAEGTTTNGACAGDATSGCTALQRLSRVAVQLTNTIAAINGSVTAGENHIGEIGSNQIKVQVAQTVTAGAYAAGNALGGLMTIANAARVSGSLGAAGTGGILTGMQLNSKTIQTGVQVDVFIFDANPTGSTCTDKTAFVIAAADFDKVVGIQTIPSTAAGGAGWFGATTTGAVGIPTYFPVTYDLSSSTSIYACAVVRAAITPAATTDISFKYNILRN